MRQLRATGLLKEITPELAAAGDGLWRSIARARSLSPPLRVGARLADERDPRRHAARTRSASSAASAASRPTRSSAASSWGCCRSRGATSSGCSRSSPCSRGCSTSARPLRAQRALLHRSRPRRSADLAGDPRRSARRRRALARAAGAGAGSPAAAARGSGGGRWRVPLQAPPPTAATSRQLRRTVVIAGGYGFAMKR